MMCKTACNKVAGGRLPYHYDLNIYRGCGHQCRYCFALYTHAYLNDLAYYDHIYVKTNIAERLEELLSCRNWKQDVINLGGITDSYQPIEEEYQIMPDILKLLIRYKTPAILSTKSDLILRDHDLIARLAEITYVNVAATITTVREDIREKLEPGAVSSERRFAMLEAFADTKANRAVHMMPIIPYLTDRKEDITALFRRAAEIRADYVLPSLLNLRGQTKSAFMTFLATDYPDLLAPIHKLYEKGQLDREFSAKTYKKVNEIKAEFKLSSNYLAAMRKRLQTDSFEQLRLF